MSRVHVYIVSLSFFLLSFWKLGVVSPINEINTRWQDADFHFCLFYCFFFIFLEARTKKSNLYPAVPRGETSSVAAAVIPGTKWKASLYKREASKGHLASAWMKTRFYLATTLLATVQTNQQTSKHNPQQAARVAWHWRRVSPPRYI